MKYTEIFLAVKIEIYLDFFDILNTFAQNIDCGFTETVLTSTHNLFWIKNKKKCSLLYPVFSI